MTLYREEFICVCVGRFLWKKSLEIQRLLISTAFVYSISTSTTARNQEAASGSFSLWCFVFAHAYFRKVGNPSGMKKTTYFCKFRAIKRYHGEICCATPDYAIPIIPL